MMFNVLNHLSSMPPERMWYDLSKEERANAVRRVHDVTFSQVSHTVVADNTRLPWLQFMCRRCNE